MLDDSQLPDTSPNALTDASRGFSTWPTGGTPISNTEKKPVPIKVPVARQPYSYRYNPEFVEPDWRRIPGYKDVTETEWNSALWQKRNFVKSVAQMKEVLGSHLSDAIAQDILKDQAERATMSML